MIPQSSHANQRWAFKGRIIHWEKRHPGDTAASSLCVCVCGINVEAAYSLPMCSLQAQHCGLISLILFLGYYDHKSLNIHVGGDYGSRDYREERLQKACTASIHLLSQNAHQRPLETSLWWELCQEFTVHVLQSHVMLLIMFFCSYPELFVWAAAMMWSLVSYIKMFN